MRNMLNRLPVLFGAKSAEPVTVRCLTVANTTKGRLPHVFRMDKMRGRGMTSASLRLMATSGSSSTNDHRSSLRPKIDPQEFKSIVYKVAGKVAHINFNRPHVYNAIDHNTPLELEQAVALANADHKVKVIVLSGEPVFCAGYDLKKYAQAERGTVPGSQKMPWDPYEDYFTMWSCTEAWMSLWRSLKPTIAKIKGVAIGGGSDIALCCDLTVIDEDAKFGYPPTRVWGCPTTAMWVYRVGPEKAKRLLLGGEVVTGRQAADMGLLGQAVPADQLDSEVDKLTARLVTVPTNQLWFQKQVVNNAIEQMGLLSTQRMATLFDGMSRHTPEGIAFQQRAKEVGFKQAVKERDAGQETTWSDINKSKL